MRKITTEELKEILRKHEMWLNDNSQGEKADFSRVDLSCAYLYEEDLSKAELSEAELSEANLYRANLRYANLRYANLS